MLTLIVIVLAIVAIVLLVGRPDAEAARSITEQDTRRTGESLSSAGVWPDVGPGTSPSTATIADGAHPTRTS